MVGNIGWKGAGVSAAGAIHGEGDGASGRRLRNFLQVLSAEILRFAQDDSVLIFSAGCEVVS
jgi:hypothetical protein